MGKKLALQSSYGNISWPNGFTPVKDYHIELVEFLELHKSAFAHISFRDIDDYDDLKRLIQKTNMAFVLWKIFLLAIDIIRWERKNIFVHFK